MERTRRAFLLTACSASVAGRVSVAEDDPDDFETIRIPGDHPTIQEGVESANAGDLVLVDPGTYAETVEVTTPEITVRGTDRNDVVLDGEFDRAYGIDVEADGVALENLTARHCAGNAFYWASVEGFRGSYLTAYNNGDYGIYAYRSRDGRFEYSYASGHTDAGFYLGRNEPFETVISDVIGERNGLEYSGTSAGGDLTIRDSVWVDNAAGIVPNTLDENDPPQRGSRIVRNVVLNNDAAPSKRLTYPAFGSGILVWGGNDNLIEDNVVSGHENFGIVAEPNVDEPSGNLIRANVVRESGVADLALGTPVGDDNRFERNAFSAGLPTGVEADASSGDERVSDVFERQRRAAESGDFSSDDWRDQPSPPDQPSMPDPEAPPRPAEKSVSWGDKANGTERDALAGTNGR